MQVCVNVCIKKGDTLLMVEENKPYIKGLINIPGGHLEENENIIEEMTDKLALAEAISKLDARSQQIIKLRFYRDLSQQQTAEILGITQVKVSREEKKIFEFLRKQF